MYSIFFYAKWTSSHLSVQTSLVSHWLLIFYLQECCYCANKGATVGCCAKTCTANYHFKCAKSADCVFLDDKQVFCRNCLDSLPTNMVSLLYRSLKARRYLICQTYCLTNIALFPTNVCNHPVRMLRKFFHGKVVMMAAPVRQSFSTRCYNNNRWTFSCSLLF